MPLIHDEVVVRSVNGPQTIRQQRTGDLVRARAQQGLARHGVALGIFLGGVVFRNLDLFEDEPHVTGV